MRKRSGAKGGARDLGGDCGNPTAHGWELQPATALLVEERHNNEALDLLLPPRLMLLRRAERRKPT